MNVTNALNADATVCVITTFFDRWAELS